MKLLLSAACLVIGLILSWTLYASDGWFLSAFPVAVGTLIALAIPGVIRVPFGHCAVVRTWDGRLEVAHGPVTWLEPWKHVEDHFWLGNRFKRFTLADIMTNQSLPIGLEVTVIYAVDPKRLPPLQRIRFLRLSEQGWHDVIELFADRVARVVVSQHCVPRADIICDREVLERALRDRLAEELDAIGVDLKGLMLHRLSPPATWQTAAIERDAAVLEAEGFRTVEQTLVDVLQSANGEHSELHKLLLITLMWRLRQLPDTLFTDLAEGPTENGETLRNGAKMQSTLPPRRRTGSGGR